MGAWPIVNEAEDLQLLVDALAELLQQSVALDDTQIRLIVASKHYGDEDSPRIQFLLGRKVDHALTAHVLSLGLSKLTEPIRLDPIPEFNLGARICVPMRYAGLLVGYLWLIEKDRLSEEQLDAAVLVAEKAAIILYRRELSRERQRVRVESLVRELISSDEHARSRAVDGLLQDAILMDRNAPSVLVVRASESAGSDFEAVFLNAGTSILTTEPAGSVLILAEPQRLVLVLMGEALTSVESMRSVAGRVLDSITAEATVECFVGLGDQQEDLADAHLSFEQAEVASRAAQHFQHFGGTATWSTLGVYSILVRMLSWRPSETEYSAYLPKIAIHRNSTLLLETAEIFLDLAGDAQRSAAALHIHRTTLYQRLTRIEQLTGLDFSNGNDRLTLHLEFKLAHISGNYRRLTKS